MAWVAAVGVVCAGLACGGEDPGLPDPAAAAPGMLETVAPPEPGPDQRPVEPLRPPTGTCTHGVYWLTELCWITTCAGECDFVRDHCNQANCVIPAQGWTDPGYPEPLGPDADR